jgi:CHAT domain-containing protein
MYAGAARVVVSLWSVDDEATSLLMVDFYRGMLQEGLTAAAALRQAQIAMWQRQQWEAPYYWAAFTVQGEWH